MPPIRTRPSTATVRQSLVHDPPGRTPARLRRAAAVLAAILLIGPMVPAPGPAATSQALSVSEPDLVVTDLVLDPSSPEEGDAVAFTATVENQGDGDAGGFDVAIEVDGSLHDTVRVSGLAAGSSTTVTSEAWTATAGDHTASATADAGDEVAEADESNNGRNTTFSVAEVESLPDLEVQDLDQDPYPAWENDSVTWTATVANTGDASGNLTLSFALDGKSLGGTDEIRSLQPGETATITSDAWAADAQAHDVRATVDPHDRVSESDESDNTRTDAVDPRPSNRPDVALQGLEAIPSSPTEGDEVVLEATVANVGDVTAENVSASFAEVATRGLGSVNVTDLAPGETATIRSDSWWPASGNHTLEVRGSAVTHHEDSPEEANNSATLTLEVDPAPAPPPPDPPNLTPSSLDVDVGPGEDDEAASASLDVSNTGEVNASSFTVAFVRDDGAVLARETLDGLPAGASSTVRTTWETDPGDHGLDARVDADEAVAESDETDNTASTSYTVPSADSGRPDLVTTDVALTPENPEPGDQVTFAATVVNTGDAVADGFAVNFTVDGNTTVGEGTVVLLEPGESATVESESWLADGGPHRVEALADPDDGTTEPIERNNDASTSFAVESQPSDLASDISVESVRPDPLAPGHSDQVGFVATVQNQGDGTTGPFDVRFELQGGDFFDLQPVLSLSPGESTTVRSNNWTAVGGPWNLTVEADPSDAVIEASEANNRLDLRFHVKVPDVVAQDVRPADDPTYSGVETPFEAVVLNRDYTASVGEVVPEGYEEQGRWSTNETGGEDFREAASVGYTTERARSGNWSMGLGWEGSDSDSDDGTLTATRTYGLDSADRLGFDFRVDEIGGGGFYEELEAGVRLQGVASDGTPTTEPVEYWVSAYNSWWSSKQPGSNEDVIAKDPPTKRWLHASVNPTDDFDLDWTGTEGIRVTLYAAVEDADFDDYQLYVDNLDVFSSHETIDGSEASPPHTANVSLDAGHFDNVTVPSLDPGEEVLLTTDEWTPTRGDHGVGLDLDLPEYVRDLDRSNHQAFQPFKTLGPDLVVDDVALDPADPRRGDDLRFNVTVRNAGGDASASDVRVDVQDHGFAETLSLPALDHGDTATVTTDAWTAVGGDQAVETTVDPGDVVDEEDEDNTRTTEFHVDRPNLVVADVSTDPASPAVGDDVRVVATVENVGRVAAGAFDVTLGPDDGPKGTTSVDGLAAGAATTVAGPSISPDPGRDILEATVDVGDDVEEDAEGDNFGADTVYVRQPDLAVASVDPGDPDLGEETRFEARVLNRNHTVQGAKIATDGMEDPGAWTTDETDYHNHNLWPDWGFVGHAGTSTFPDGPEDLNRIVEIEPAFRHGADGRVLNSRTFDVGSVEEVEISYRVDEHRHFGWEEQMDAGIRIVPLDGAGDVADHPITYWLATWKDFGDLEPGDHTVKVNGRPDLHTWHRFQGRPDADFGYNAPDWDKVEQVRVELYAQATDTRWDNLELRFDDLRILGADPARPSVQASSTAAATGTSFRLDGGTDLGTADTPSLEPGEAVNVTSASWNATKGDHVVEAVADAGDVVAERDEGNNARTASFHPDAPDLVVSDLDATPSSPAHGDATSFSATVVNQGELGAAETAVRVDVDGKTVGNLSVPALGPGESATVTTGNWTAVGGDHLVRAVADPADGVPEEAEGNNEATLDLHVREPDLTVTSLGPDPSPPEDRQTVAFPVKVANHGDAAAPDHVVDVTVDDDVALGPVDVPGLAPGEAVTVSSLEWTAVGGSHVVEAVVDPGNGVAESDETDNARTEPFLVKRSDVTVPDVDAGGADPAAGDTIAFAATVGNLFVRDDLDEVREDDMEDPTPWSFAKHGGWSFKDASFASFTGDYAVSGDRSLRVGFDGGRGGSDFGRVKAIRTFDVDRVDDISARFLVDRLSKPDSNWDNLAAGLDLRGLGTDGEVVERYEYWFAAWEGHSWGRSTGPNEIQVHGKPPTDEWTLFNATPTDDFGTNWTATERVEVRVFAGGGGSFGDEIRLHVDDLTLGRSSPAPSGAPARNFTVGFQLGDGTSLVSAHVDRLDPRNTTTVASGSWNATPGFHDIRAEADPDDRLAEKDESNNVGVGEVYVRAPNLTVADVTLDPSPPYAGENVSVRANVTNAGDADADPSKVRFRLDTEDGDVDLGNADVGVLAPGETVTVESESTWNATTGAHVWNVTADWYDGVLEHEEADNAHTGRFVVDEAPDATPVGEITSHPSDPPSSGETTTFNATIENVGDGPLDPTVVEFTLDGDPLGDVPVGTLDPGENVTVTSEEWDATIGTHTIEMTADGEEDVRESDESNNTASRTFTVI